MVLPRSTSPSVLRRKRSSPWPRVAVLVVTAILALLGTVLVGNIFVLQSFDQVLHREHAASVPSMLAGGRSLRLSQTSYGGAAGNSEKTELFDVSAVPPQHKPEPPGLKMAWLMSFPNSGTSFTSRLVRDATKTDSASNYADETPSGQNGLRLPVYEDQPDGPFWIKPEASPEFSEPTEYVITKVRSN